MIYLFDWGNTLMVDFPHAQGKMCDWNTVEAIPQAKETLAMLCKEHQIYIATSASDSAMEDVQKAFQRVDLDQYISGYFCFSNIGIKKNCAEFYQAVAKKLGVSENKLTMVGDVPSKDIYPAMEAGLNTIWFNAAGESAPGKPIAQQIRCLSELILNTANE
ncbi:HAD family hydrolase [Vibrio sp. J1-1]|uniref:HAD family hydrolase n=1 Tax=Vibrio sp. J1-1 TaxID=2912251 RepID=UPI001F3FC38F|nr:HAD family hydrolase [Vibrio sp. J1-1]MBR9873678.1 HAD family hydrolase [Vibrionaceae bacterium]MCF7480635.1 HAD family hydrolase [Vibrio sp. J1-1]